MPANSSSPAFMNLTMQIIPLLGGGGEGLSGGGEGGGG